VGEDRGDDGGSVSSDLVATRRERRKTNREDQRERIRATLPGSVHLWTRSRRRSPDRSRNRVRGVQRLAGFFSSEGSRAHLVFFLKKIRKIEKKIRKIKIKKEKCAKRHFNLCIITPFIYSLLQTFFFFAKLTCYRLADKNSSLNGKRVMNHVHSVVSSSSTAMKSMALNGHLAELIYYPT
jgi:hypothetical protein